MTFFQGHSETGQLCDPTKPFRKMLPPF